MRDLIPTIIIEQKYRIRAGYIEDVCPQCGASSYYNEEIVLILGVAECGDGYYCGSCNKEFGTISAGWYNYTDKKGRLYCVPYTQLFPLEESHDTI